MDVAGRQLDRAADALGRARAGGNLSLRREMSLARKRDDRTAQASYTPKREDCTMIQIERVASNTPWEPIFGYVRKVKAGNWLAISGTTATDERGMIVG